MAFLFNLHQALVDELLDFPRGNPSCKMMFVNGLRVNYHAMLATTKLCGMAAERCPQLKDYFLHHALEEAGHQALQRKDLEILGARPGQAPQAIVTMVGELYYKVLHQQPEMLLGYLYFMEAFPIPPQHLEQLQALYPGATRCIELHRREDLRHSKELRSILESLPVRLQDQIQSTAIRCAKLYGEALWASLFEGVHDE